MRYIKQCDIISYLNDKDYSSISITGSISGMKKTYGWDKAIEIVKSSYFYYAIWGQKKKRFFAKTAERGKIIHVTPIWASNEEEALKLTTEWFDSILSRHNGVQLITEEEYLKIYER